MASEKEIHPKKTWEPMSLRFAGDVGEVIKGGGGKLTLVGTDPGEVRKVRSQS